MRAEGRRVLRLLIRFVAETQEKREYSLGLDAYLEKVAGTWDVARK